MFGLVSAGGLAREVMPLVRQMGVFDRAVFVEKNRVDFKVNGHTVLTEEEFFSIQSPKEFNVALGSSKDRERLSNIFLARGCVPFTIRAKTSIMYDDVVMKEGAIICDYTILTSNVKIGKYFQANIYSYVAHDCIIGDYVTFAPKVCCNGRVSIGNHVYIGTGAVIRENITIGDGAVIGAGAVVVKDVLPYTTVVGNPAKIMEKK
jgi:sugar O-acyltransferase (sialic acid O-acetyltransferase NeuD family)